MNRKIVFIDVDGTMYHAHEESLRETVHTKLLEASKHVDLYLSTGRAMCVLSCLGKSMDLFKGFVLTNGTLVLKDNTVLLNNFFKKEVLIELIKKAKEFEAVIGLISKDKVYVNKYSPVVEYALQPHFSGAIVELGDYNFDLDIEYNMVWTFDPNEIIDKVTSNIDGVDVFKWGSIGGDIVPKGMTKAIGIKRLLEEINMPLDNTYAIGDSGNDVAMFKLVKNPICMGNGTDIAKGAAKYITEPIDEFGLENALDRIIKGEW